jgi:MFS family permease
MVRWVAAAGAFVVSLDSMVNIAFPAIATAFGAPPERVRWVIVCYVGCYAVMSFVAGAAADRIGHVPVFRAGLVVSIAGFALCGTAPSFGLLLAGRAVQGVAGGLVYGTAPALATLGAAASLRGRRLGFLNAAIGLGFASGPVLAGVLIDALGWRAVFHARVPAALVVLGWALAVRPRGSADASRPLVAARDVLRAPVLAAGGLSFVANAAIFAIWLLAPFYIVGVRGLSASAGGVLFMLTPLGTAAAAPLAGRLTDRVGARAPMVAGLVLEALGLGALSRAEATTPLAAVALALGTAGFGLGVFQVPNMASVMAAFPARHAGAAGGLAFLARTLGVVTGVAILGAVFAGRRAVVGFQSAFGEALALAAVAVAGAATAGLAVGRARAYTPGR